jgi:alanyl-tRNA synthetase
MKWKSMNSQPYYWTDSHRSEFEIEIVSILEVNGSFHIRINKPVVKPTSGGQAGDRGALLIDGREYEFIDTILQNGHTVLVMKNSPIAREGKGQLILDMTWREAMMANHTSEHIFVGFMKKKYSELKLGRIWIDGNHGTVLLEGRVVPLEEILTTEIEVNRVIREEIDVTTKVVSAEDVDKSVRAREGVTSKNDAIRLVNVGDFDSSACSGIHVTNTRDIRLFKIIDVKAVEGNTHIEFVSGRIALDRVTEIYNTALVRKYSYPYEIEQLGPILDKSKALQTAYEKATEKILQLMKKGPSKEQINGTTFWYEYLPGLEVSTLRHLIKELKLKEPSLTLFLTADKKANIVVWTKGMPNDTAYYISDIVQGLGGRGGGSSESYTGGFTEVSEPEVLFQKIVDKVRKKIQE